MDSITIAELYGILPQLILSFAIVMALLLIAVRRSQRMIFSLTIVSLLLALIAVCQISLTGELSVTVLLQVNKQSLFALGIILAAGLVITLSSFEMLKQHTDMHDEYYLLLLLAILGASILVTSKHFASLFLGFELLSIALVGMVAYSQSGSVAVETGFKYLILSATASSFMLLGIAFYYGVTGSLQFDAHLPVIAGMSLLMVVGLLLILIGICFKLSLVPFHFWTPDVYQGAPISVTMLLATVSKVAIFVVLMRFWFSQHYFQSDYLMNAITAIAILSMLVGNILAIKQQQLKRLFGYSSIAHMGYLLIVIMLSTSKSEAFAWQTALFYLSAYVIASLSIFLIVQLSQQHNNESTMTIEHWRGLFWHQPAMAVLVIISVLSFAGIPLTMGFIGKFYLLAHATKEQLWLAASALIAGSGIALVYYLRVIFTLFERKETEETPSRLTVPARVLVVLLTLSTLVFGLMPDVLSQLI